jgi:hypothetical protein
MLNSSGTDARESLPKPGEDESVTDTTESAVNEVFRAWHTLSCGRNPLRHTISIQQWALVSRKAGRWNLTCAENNRHFDGGYVPIMGGAETAEGGG